MSFENVASLYFPDFAFCDPVAALFTTARSAATLEMFPSWPMRFHHTSRVVSSVASYLWPSVFLIPIWYMTLFFWRIPKWKLKSFGGFDDFFGWHMSRKICGYHFEQFGGFFQSLTICSYMSRKTNLNRLARFWLHFWAIENTHLNNFGVLFVIILLQYRVVHNQERVPTLIQVRQRLILNQTLPWVEKIL